MNSRMPLAKMRSSGAVTVLAPLALCRSFRLRPDQNSRSKSSLPWRTRFRPKNLPKITVQLASDTAISPAMTSCTTKLACSIRVMMERSWFMKSCLVSPQECGKVEVLAGGCADTTDSDVAFGQKFIAAPRLLRDAQRGAAVVEHAHGDVECVVQACRAQQRSVVSATTNMTPSCCSMCC